MKSKIYPGGAVMGVLFVLSLLFFAARLNVRIRLNRQLKNVSNDAISAGEKSAAPSRASFLEADIDRLAKEAGVHQLRGLHRSGGRGDSIRIEWESGAAAGLDFLIALTQSRRVGPCASLQISSNDHSPLVSGQAEFELASVPLSKSPISASTQAARLFRPLAAERLSRPKPDLNRLRKIEAARRRAEEERRRREQAERDDRRQRDDIRRRLTSALSLNGIVNDGKGPLAFIGSAMVREGDVVQEAVVTSIDEERGEVRLNYKGQFDVVLKLTSQTGGPF